MDVLLILVSFLIFWKRYISSIIMKFTIFGNVNDFHLIKSSYSAVQ